MHEVICDTSVIQYLHQLKRLHLLRDLYGRITVPEEVIQELAVGRNQGVDLPVLTEFDWIDLQRSPVPPTRPKELGAGEIAVLALAKTRSDSVVVLDDRLAREFARHQGTPCTGTCGILLRAKERGMVPALSPLLDKLEALGFRLDRGTRHDLLFLAGEPD